MKTNNKIQEIKETLLDNLIRDLQDSLEKIENDLDHIDEDK